MKTVAVYFDDPGEYDYPFNGEFYKRVYRELAEEMLKLGVPLHIIRAPETYLGKSFFSKAWKFDGQWFREVPGPIRVDVVWNKGRRLKAADLKQINDPELDAICLDKWRCFQLFPHLYKKTLLVSSPDELPRALRELEGTRVTLKPLSGWGGFNVLIGSREEVTEKNSLYPCVVQEFVDTSKGIEGIVDGMHDFRILSLNGKIGLSYVRTPPPGMFTANVSQGGKEIEVPPGKVPNEALIIFSEVDKSFARFAPRIYTVDMGREADGKWYVFEINGKPGFSPMETGESYPPFYRNLAVFLIGGPTK